MDVNIALQRIQYPIYIIFAWCILFQSHIYFIYIADIILLREY